ncbi:MAG: TolC family protein [Archangium sp.]
MWSVALSLLLSTSPTFELSTLEKGEALPELLWQRSPELQQARANVAAAKADFRKTTRLPNPDLDVGVNTLPVGQLNPPGLKDPFLNVPNVAVSLSVLLEVGKREPRQNAAAERAKQAALEAQEALRQKLFDAYAVLADVAAAQVRVSILEGLASDAHRLTELQGARAKTGDTAELDVDRAQLEEENVNASLGDAREQLQQELRTCAVLLAMPCSRFRDAAQANVWLDRRFESTERPVEERPDLKALESTARAARADETLAKNQWIPDFTVRAGYVHDRFIESGNQMNSVFVGFSVPLRVFDHGQDSAQAAAVAAKTADDVRARLIEIAANQRARLTTEVDAVEARQTRLREKSVPLAQQVVDRLTAAVTRGSSSLQELLLSRRTLSELLLTAAEMDRRVFQLHLERARLSGVNVHVE